MQVPSERLRTLIAAAGYGSREPVIAGWPGLRALLARIPDLNQSLVIIALADDSERRTDLAAGMLDLVTALPREHSS